MPVGSGAVTDLLPTPEQRTAIYHRIREFRSTKPIFSMDFQNDAEYVGGCIAGGRRYLHINARGDVEPCVFIHYSNAKSTDYEAPEEADTLCDRTTPYAESWKPVAEELWRQSPRGKQQAEKAAQ